MTEKRMWNDKPYHSLDYELKKTFGKKVYKVSLDAGMTCPNRDGTLGTRGCIFCSAGGSGDFAIKEGAGVTEQIDRAIAHTSRYKNVGDTFIAYFQAYTNTYAPIEQLRALYLEALSHPKVAVLSIATRPDCLDDEILSLLAECNRIKPVWIELGLQTVNEATAAFIRRGYPLSVFDDAVERLHRHGIMVITHVILGLPFEEKQDMLATISHISSLPIQGVKLQLLHILKGTDLAAYVDKIKILSEYEYIDLLIACIEALPPDIVIHRITGDGPKKDLLAPLWSADKRHVLNAIHKRMKELGSYQGKCYFPSGTKEDI